MFDLLVALLSFALSSVATSVFIGRILRRNRGRQYAKDWPPGWSKEIAALTTTPFPQTRRKE